MAQSHDLREPEEGIQCQDRQGGNDECEKNGFCQGPVPEQSACKIQDYQVVDPYYIEERLLIQDTKKTERISHRLNGNRFLNIPSQAPGVGAYFIASITSPVMVPSRALT